MNKKWVLIPLMIVAISMVVLWGFSSYYQASPQAKANREQQATKTSEGTASNTQGTSGGRTVAGAATAGSTTTQPGTPDEPQKQQERFYCTGEQRQAESCEPDDHPVCGWFDPEQTQCGNGPCVRSTFPNICEACRAPAILYWTDSECPIHE